ncbi:MAG TPA: APC family permease [Terriglobales bacterium]|nr:APC family permease [Terriglobales bacterium]
MSSGPRQSEQPGAPQAKLARRLGLFDATMIVMGGIIGSGIFINYYVVAQVVHTPVLILGAWLAGGVIALAGAFIYAELADRMPQVGGQYAYIREAYHPSVAFVYGWGLLLVTQTGGMAAVSIAFARYTIELTGTHAPDWLLAVIVLAVLTVVNCMGVRMGGTVQDVLMVLKIGAIAALVLAGFALVHPSQWSWHPAMDRPMSGSFISAFAAAMVPVLFSYGGWQTSCFVAGEMRDPRRDLPRGLLIGVVGVILLYLSAGFVYVRALGAAGLAVTSTPASSVMRLALGEPGAKLIAAGIAISGLGFLSQGILTAPRVYFAMADDGLFFRALAWVHPRTRVPVVAIVVQSVWTIVIALSGRYEQILNYVVATDFIFFGLSATCLFVFRHRDRVRGESWSGYRVPGHPFTTFAFVAVSWLVVLNTMIRYPKDSLVGTAILLAGITVYFIWGRRRSRWRQPQSNEP